MTEDGAPPLDTWLADYELETPLTTQTSSITLRGTRKRDGRHVIIRVLEAQGRLSVPARRALEKERDALERIDHPNIPALLEVLSEPRGESPRMALVLADHGGPRLDAVLDRKPTVEPASAIAIAIELGRALTAMHRHDEPHGSVRTDLVELTADGAVYLHGTGQRYHLALRGAEVELALPVNMAPEQIIGDAADEQTDVFLLGMLLYRMVAGQPAFDAAEGSVSHHIRHGAPTPLGRHVKHPTEGLERILARCLQKRPRDRYEDMASLVSELLRALRSATSLSTEVLVSRCLADAGLGDALPPPRERGVERGTTAWPPWVGRATWGVAAALGVTAFALLAYNSCGDGEAFGPGDPRGILKRPAQIKVLAHPWAEVHIDGTLVDVTPIGFPIEVTPGRHVIVFKHPHAPEETRPIEIIAGQTIVLDVEMRITRPADAGLPDAGEVDASDEALSP